jgi:hypothetical protein
MSKYPTPSHEQIHKPGNEGSCPSMPTESINGKDFPNGEQSAPMVGPIDLGSGPDIRHRGSSPSNDPMPAMPGA